MAEKKYYWLKLEKDFFKQKEIKKLRKVAGGDTLTIIYLKLALLSLENNGYLLFEGLEKDIADELELELDEEVENIKLVLSFMQNHNMIEPSNEKDFYMNRIPEMTGTETDAAKRMRISRNNRKDDSICNNVTDVLQVVTDCYTEKEKELDIESDKKKKKGKEKESKETIVDEIKKLDISEELKKKLIDFLEYRKEIKKPLNSLRSITTTIKLIGSDFTSEKHLIESIDYTISKGWQGIQPKPDNKKGEKGDAGKTDEQKRREFSESCARSGWNQ